MAKTTKTKVDNKVEKKQGLDSVNQLKEMYNDFRDTIAEIMGDTGEFVLKHKALVFFGFLLYLWNRNRTFTIEGFVKKLEQRLSNGSDWVEYD